MKLLADATLGRLAKWLRIVGYDTAYLADTDDFAMVRLARTEDRLILTRDSELSAQQGIRALLIDSDVLEDQLQQVWSSLGPPPGSSAPRCPVCNHALVEAGPDVVANRVPAYVLRTQEHFTICRQCDRVYWQGSHWEKMRSLIKRLVAEGTINGLRDASGSDRMERDVTNS